MLYRHDFPLREQTLLLLRDASKLYSVTSDYDAGWQSLTISRCHTTTSAPLG
jgi:hypothetical protein